MKRLALNASAFGKTVAKNVFEPAVRVTK